MSVNFTHCIKCHNKFKPDWDNTSKIYYFGKLEYEALFCEDCISEYGYCNYCEESHWYPNQLDDIGIPVCEPADNPDSDLERYLVNNYSSFKDIGHIYTSKN